MQPPILKLDNVTVKLSGKPVLQDVCFEMKAGESWAITGASGSGKTVLAHTLLGRHFHSGTIETFFGEQGNSKIICIGQQHSFKNGSNLNSFYYQQRFNSYDSEDAATVISALENIAISKKPADSIGEVLQLLGISHLRETKLLQLSNGEHKRFQVAKALLQNPALLIMDSPFVGLDAAARKLLHNIINELIKKGIRILLITSPGEIPSAINRIALLENGKVIPVEREIINNMSSQKKQTQAVPSSLQSIPAAYQYPEFTTAIKLAKVKVEYNGKKILENINWEVKRGECWMLSGHNGAGKSTLLSLITGDNPQAFANEIYLFDRKKGTGESIWDIKQKIGYISPELHHYFAPGFTCFQVVASGLFDSIGLFRKLNKQQEQLVNQWMKVLGIEDLQPKLLRQLSNGQQRMVLLARALIKNPPLLILDEPCQGLDKETTQQFISLINHICVSLHKTLIYVSHYHEEKPECVNLFLKLDKGKIAA